MSRFRLKLMLRSSRRLLELLVEERLNLWFVGFCPSTPNPKSKHETPNPKSSGFRVLGSRAQDSRFGVWGLFGGVPKLGVPFWGSL